jgi:uncharacterized protein
MDDSFLIFALVGFLAQLVDGALGMAYGVVSSTALLSFGVTPAAASASVHAAEVFTTAASAGSHAWHRNVNWRLFAWLAPAGVVGGILGAFVLTAFDGDALKPFVATYLCAMGVYILFRAWTRPVPRDSHHRGFVAPLGLVGGTFDALGGGGWGPVVTTALVGTGGTPRHMIGTVNTAEFVVTVAISAAFVAALLTGHWEDAGDLTAHLWAVGGLIAGGMLAAPLAGYVTRIIPAAQLMWLVGGIVTLLGAYQAARLF